MVNNSEFPGTTVVDLSLHSSFVTSIFTVIRRLISASRHLSAGIRWVRVGIIESASISFPSSGTSLEMGGNE